MKKEVIINLWKCPKCGRQFEREGQTHSCRPFPLDRHFERKPYGKALYEKFTRLLKKQLGSFKVESLECCIHFVSTFTFAAVKILKEKIRVDFALSESIKHPRIKKCLRMSANRFLCVIDITKEEEIDLELMKWIQEAHDKPLKEKGIYKPKTKTAVLQ